MIKRFLILFFFSVLMCSSVQARREKNVNIYDHPREAPATGFYSSDGKNMNVSDFKDSFVMMMFWSRDCYPCLRELDDLNEFYKKTKNHGIKLIMLSHDREWKDSNEQKLFLEDYNAPDLPFYVDKGGKLAAALGVFTSPHTVLFNKQGKEIGRIRGAAEWGDDRVINYIYKIKAENNE